MLTKPEKTASSARHINDLHTTTGGAPRRDADGRWVDLRPLVMPADEKSKPKFDDSTKAAIEAALEAAFASSDGVTDNVRYDQPIRKDTLPLASAKTISDETSLAAIEQELQAQAQQATVRSATPVLSAPDLSAVPSWPSPAPIPPPPPQAFIDPAPTAILPAPEAESLFLKSAPELTEEPSSDAEPAESAPVPEVVIPEGAAIERRDSGPISKVRFTNGSTAQYRYNQQGELCAFIYARLAWDTDDGHVWTARDKDNEYCLEGRVSVEPDGTLCIQKKDIIRRIFLDGTRYDLHPDGSGQTSRPAQREASPGDLLVMWRRLSPTPIGKRSGPIQTEAPPPAVKSVSTLPKLANPVEFKPAYVPPLSTSASAQAKTMPSVPKSQAAPITNPPAMSIDVGQSSQGKEEQVTTIKAHLTVRPQRLRTRDDYVKPRDAGLPTKFKTSMEHFLADASIKLISKIGGEEDARLIPHIDTLAKLAYEQRAIEQAEKLHERALSLREHFYGRSHETCAVNLQGLGKIQYERSNYSEAAKLYQEAISLHEKNVRKLSFLNSSGLLDEQAREAAITDLLQVINALAQMYAEQAKYQDGEAQFKRALDAWNSLPVATSDELCEVMHTILRNYKELLRRANRHIEAEALDAQTEILLTDPNPVRTV